MGSLSNFGEQEMLKHLITEAAHTPTATVYLALATADPTDTATGASMSEVANSGSYARTAITFGAAASRRITQSGAVVFPEATGAWGTVTHWAIVSSATHGAGNVLASGAFTSSFAVVAGNIRTVPSAEIYVEISASPSAGGLTNYAANGFLDRMFRNQAFTVSATYLSLFTVTPSDSVAGTEVSGGSYARKQVNAPAGASPAWAAASGGASQNANDALFTAPTGSWGTVVAGGIHDAVTTGNLLWWLDLTDQAVSTETTQIGYITGDLDIAVT
jgi:hypothetical protein